MEREQQQKLPSGGAVHHEAAAPLPRPRAALPVRRPAHFMCISRNSRPILKALIRAGLDLNGASASLETDALVSLSARRGQGAKPSLPRGRAGSRDAAGHGQRGWLVTRSFPDRPARSQRRQQTGRGTVCPSRSRWPLHPAQPGTWVLIMR